MGLPIVLVGLLGIGVVSCSPSRFDVGMPPVPMDWPDQAQQQPAVEDTLPPGVCPPFALSTLGEDEIDALTVLPEQLEELPQVVSMPTAEYPESERDEGWEGELAVRMLVAPDGLVLKVDIGTGDDPFVVAAAKAACGGVFTPVRSAGGGQACTWMNHRFGFSLDIAVPSDVPREGGP